MLREVALSLRQALEQLQVYRVLLGELVAVGLQSRGLSLDTLVSELDRGLQLVHVLAILLELDDQEANRVDRTSIRRKRYASVHSI